MTEHDTPQQLTLLPSSELPVRLRLDADTRRRGLQHVAEIRRYLDERRAAKEAEHAPTATRRPVRPARRPAA